MSGLGIPGISQVPRTEILRAGAEVAPLMETDVQPVYLVPRRAQEQNQDGSHIAPVTGDENPHLPPPPDYGDESGAAARPSTPHLRRSAIAQS
jgi:hypothetical protein